MVPAHTIQNTGLHIRGHTQRPRYKHIARKTQPYEYTHMNTDMRRPTSCTYTHTCGHVHTCLHYMHTGTRTRTLSLLEHPATTSSMPCSYWQMGSSDWVRCGSPIPQWVRTHCPRGPQPAELTGLHSSPLMWRDKRPQRPQLGTEVTLLPTPPPSDGQCLPVSAQSSQQLQTSAFTRLLPSCLNQHFHLFAAPTFQNIQPLHWRRG